MYVLKLSLEEHVWCICIDVYYHTDAENSFVIESRKHSRNTDDSKLLQEYKVVYSGESRYRIHACTCVCEYTQSVTEFLTVCAKEWECVGTFAVCARVQVCVCHTS